MKNYQTITAITDSLSANPIVYRKKEVTLGRVPSADEIGQTLVTYVKSENGIKQESDLVLTSDHVIARNPHCLGEIDGVEVYNEWAMEKETWMKNYEVEPTTEFAEYKKAAPITDETLQLLDSEDGETAIIEVSWNETGMVVYKGGVLTDQGYGIAPNELRETYEVVE